MRSRVAAGAVVLGTMISEVHSPNLGRMLATAGLDFFVIDMEHGTCDWSSMAAMIAVARGCGIAPLVRVPEIRRDTVLKPLDAGAAGLVVPMVETEEEARTLVGHALYPPEGRRGTALRRAHSDYARVTAAEYLPLANQEILLMIQIETRRALDNLDRLLSVPGVHAAFVGPFDLSVDLGVPGDTGSPLMQEAYARVIAAARRHGVAAGIQMFDLELSARLIRDGMQIVSYGSDVNMLIDGAAHAARVLRQESKGETPSR